MLASPQLIYVTGSDLPRHDVLHYSCKQWTNDEACYAANCTEENIGGGDIKETWAPAQGFPPALGP